MKGSNAARRNAVPPGLDAYFRAASRYLRGEASAEEFQAQAGPVATPPRGTAEQRLGFYRKLVHRTAWKILEGRYAPLRDACEMAEEALGPDQGRPAWVGVEGFEALVEAFLRVQPASSWHLNRMAEGFPEYLRARGRHDASQPAWLYQLAELCWTEYTVRLDSRGYTPERVNPALAVRQYSYNVSEFFLASRAGKKPLPRLREQPDTRLLYRDPETLWVRHYQPTTVMVFVLAHLQGEIDRATLLRAGFGVRVLRTALGELKRLHVVGANVLLALTDD